MKFIKSAVFLCAMTMFCAIGASAQQNGPLGKPNAGTKDSMLTAGTYTMKITGAPSAPPKFQKWSYLGVQLNITGAHDSISAFIMGSLDNVYWFKVNSSDSVRYYTNASGTHTSAISYDVVKWPYNRMDVYNRGQEAVKIWGYWITQ